MNYKLKQRQYIKQNKLKLYKERISSSVVNLSSYTLSQHELSILAKGLTFIPKPKHLDTDDIESGLQKLTQQLKAQFSIKSKQTTTTREGPTPIYNPKQTISKFTNNGHKHDRHCYPRQILSRGPERYHITQCTKPNNIYRQHL